MNVGIYDPYLDTLGGGERYVLSIAKYFEKDNDVTVFWDNDLTSEINRKFPFNFKKINFQKNIFKNGSIVDKRNITRNFDLFFFISDGSIPFLFAKKNFLIFQFPPQGKKLSFVDMIKLRNIDKVICYSNFVKRYLDKIFKLNSFVLYPSVDMISTKLPKENIILNVGRFTKGVNNKKQEFMIDAFNKLGNKDWKFILAGSYLSGDKDFVEDLKTKIKNSNVEILESPSFTELSKIYSKSKIYWHATGAGEDINRDPGRAEHFGISTVEAMSAGSVPVVINAGGQKEIVRDNVSGYLWSTQESLVDKTKALIENENLLSKFSEGAKLRASIFSPENFYKNIKLLIS